MLELQTLEHKDFVNWILRSVNQPGIMQGTDNNCYGNAMIFSWKLPAHLSKFNVKYSAYLKQVGEFV